MSRDIMLEILCGSRAYNLQRDKDDPRGPSDWDKHAIWLAPTSSFFSVGAKEPKGTHIQTDEDISTWELGHFINLAVHCNPTVLETFVAPVLKATALGIELRKMMPLFLSRKRIRDAFIGYSMNQRKKMLDPASKIDNRRDLKFAVAYIRSLTHGITLLRDGTYDPWLEGSTLEVLKEIRDGHWSKGKIIDLAEARQQLLEETYLDSVVQLEPQVDKINEWLVKVRKENF